MIHFKTDYMSGACEPVMRKIIETNNENTAGYGADPRSKHAASLIKEACGLPEESVVFFLVGGTQTNATILDTMLYKGHGVLCTETAHINVHEAGAVEETGHKVLPIADKAVDSEGKPTGKMRPEALLLWLKMFYSDDTYEHMVNPSVVYLSQPSEFGTIYSLKELEQIRAICDEYGLYLYIDGARLGAALAAEGNEVTLKDLSRLCDAFYIGGTKMGALLGEAVVMPDPKLLRHVITFIKSHGALLAKGHLQGVQFEALFTDDNYYKIGRHEVELAMLLNKGLKEKGYKTYINSPTNQQFFVLPNEVIDRLQKVATFELWGPRREKETPVRFVTTWSTTKADVEDLLAAI